MESSDDIQVNDSPAVSTEYHSVMHRIRRSLTDSTQIAQATLEAIEQMEKHDEERQKHLEEKDQHLSSHASKVEEMSRAVGDLQERLEQMTREQRTKE